jgi:hypothetical protein
MSNLRKATRKKAKIRLGLSAVAGGGKTYSGLLIAKGLCGDWSKIAVIDTENGSADLYCHLGDYNVLPLQAPYSPEKYIAAIQDCEKAGMEVIMIDSITHEWDGKGGCLEIVDQITQGSTSKNSYIAWGKVTPRHQAFIEAMLTSQCHIITTVRRKQDYEMTKDEKGKLLVEKAGLKEVTRDGWEYELTVNLQLDTSHLAKASKDRTGLFMDKPEFKPTEDTGRMIAEWCEDGIDPKVEIDEAIKKLANCSTIDELKLFKETLSFTVVNDPGFKHAGIERFNQINNSKKAENAN